MKLNSYYLQKEINFILFKMNNIKLKYNLFKNLYLNNNFVNIKRKLPNTVTIFSEILINNILVELCALITNCDKDDISIKRFLVEYKNGEFKKILKEKKYIYVKNSQTRRKKRLYLKNNNLDLEIIKLYKYFADSESTISFIKFFRNKKIAHFDKKIILVNSSDNNKKFLTYKELEKFIDIIYNNFHKIYSVAFGKDFVYSNNSIMELGYLNELLK